MGASIACLTSARLSEELPEEMKRIKAVILEAGFNNFEEQFKYKLTASKNFVISTFLATGKMLPGTLLSMLTMRFDSDKNICKISAPVLILHAMDDKSIPFSFGEKLYEAARGGGKEDVQLVSFPQELGFAHSQIWKAENLPEILQGFLQKYL